MINYWIFIARRYGGTLEKIREVINGGSWDFVSRDSESKTPQFHEEFSKGDFVLFYLADTYPDRKKIDGGRSIIGKARLQSPYIVHREYTEEDIPTDCFVFLSEPNTKISKKIEPRNYGIGQPGQMVVKISEDIYKKLLN